MVRKFLIIDTSGNESFVALHLPTQEIVIETLPPLKQSQTLLPAIETLYSDDLEFIAVGTGPGSFTGTRVGVMTAKALGFARSVPLVPFCSLKCFLPKDDGPFTITTDAKSHGFYTLKGIKEGENYSFEKPTLSDIDQSTLTNKLNLESLAPLLMKENGVAHSDLEVTYLHTP